jgi:hypothetical protein
LFAKLGFLGDFYRRDAEKKRQQKIGKLSNIRSHSVGRDISLRSRFRPCFSRLGVAAVNLSFNYQRAPKIGESKWPA